MSSLTLLVSRLRMRHLRLLIALHEHGTVQKAAEAVALTQPGATKALNEIEALLGVQLFQRTYKGLEITDMGLCAVRYARLIYSDLAHFHEELESMQQGKGGRLSVGLIMGAVPLISTALSRVRSQQPAISIEIVEDTSARLLSLLDRGRLDAAICRSRVNQRPYLYDSLNIHEEQLAVICHPGNPLVQREQVTLADLADISWIVYPANMPMRLLLEREFHEANLQFPLYPIETASAFTSISMLRHDCRSVALMSVDAAQPFCDSGMVSMLPIHLYSRSEPYELVTRKGTTLSPATCLFMKEVTLVGNLCADAAAHIESIKRGN